MSFSSSPQKYITIATDISAFESMGIWTWACYIRWGGGVIKKTGQFKEIPNGTTHAETLALCNALVIAYKEIEDYPQSRIIIHNEIEIVLEPIISRKKKIMLRDADRAKAIVNVALPLLDRAQSWERRKIKAHFKNWQDSDNPAKYAINRWCDKAARDHMRGIRRAKKKL